MNLVNPPSILVEYWFSVYLCVFLCSKWHLMLFFLLSSDAIYALSEIISSLRHARTRLASKPFFPIGFLPHQHRRFQNRLSSLSHAFSLGHVSARLATPSNLISSALWLASLWPLLARSLKHFSFLFALKSHGKWIYLHNWFALGIKSTKCYLSINLELLHEITCKLS